MATTRDSRKFDVVLYGASGFVGRQTVAYFAQQPHVTALGLKWAIAGRSADKLEVVRKAFGSTPMGVLVAEAQDAAAMDRLARSTRVVLSTAGPFALYGSELVAACVRHGTHYVDITGETPWVRGLIDRHHEDAQRKGVRIIPFCGFDSIPSDLSARLANEAMWDRFGEACTQVKAAFSIRGGFNGGTLASLFNMLASGQSDAMADPFLLNPAGTLPVDVSLHGDPVTPRLDPDFSAWLGPFMMSTINTRVVRRSAVSASGARTDRRHGGHQPERRLVRITVGVATGSHPHTGAEAGAQTRRWPVRSQHGWGVVPLPVCGPQRQRQDRARLDRGPG